MDSTATNTDLVKEIANYVNRQPNALTLRLELPGGQDVHPTS